MSKSKPNRRVAKENVARPEGRTGNAGRPERRIARVLNLRLLGITLIVIAVAGLGAYSWRSYQVRRTAGVFLQRAAALEQEEKWLAAAGFLDRYLELRPNDASARIRLAELFDKGTETSPGDQRAIELYYSAIGVAPAEKVGEVRCRLGELLIKAEDYAAAQEQAEKVLDDNPDDGPACGIAARAMLGRFRASTLPPAAEVQVAEAFEKAIALDPGNAELCQSLADIYRKEPRLLNAEREALPAVEREKLADALMDRLIAADPDNPKARLARYVYRMDCGLPNPEEDLKAALQLAPNDVDVLLQAADDARREAVEASKRAGSEKEVETHLAEAVQQCEKAVAAAPKEVRPYLALAELQIIRGELPRAEETCRRALAETGEPGIGPLSLLFDSLLRQGKLPDAQTVLGRLTGAVKAVDPRVPADVRTSLRASTQLMQARLSWQSGERAKAVDMLRTMATSPNAKAAPDDLYTLLAEAYQSLGQWDSAAGVHEKVAQLRPESAEPLRAAAVAWETAGQPAKAAVLYQLAASKQDTPETRVALARALLSAEIGKPVEQRSWQAFQKAYAEARDAVARGGSPEAWRLDLLNAEFVLARGREQGKSVEARAEALELLRNAENAHPESLALAQSLALLYDRHGARPDAERALARVEKISPGSTTTAQARSRLLVARGEREEAARVLAEALKTASADDRTGLILELAQVEVLLNRFKEARERLLREHDANPSHLGVVRFLAELALAAAAVPENQRWIENWGDETKRWEEKLREIEGEEGSQWKYFKARRLLAEAASSTDPVLNEAEGLVKAIQLARPGWYPGYLLSAQVLERRGMLKEAVTAYEQAARLGAAEILAVHERLIPLLMQLGRFDEVDAYLARLDEQIAGSNVLESVDMARADMQGKPDVVLRLAQRGVEVRPSDSGAHARLGRALALNQEMAEAEKEFQKALELAQTEGDRTIALQALFDLYVRTQRTDLAREQLETLAKSEGLTEQQRKIVLAQGLEALGDPTQAETLYREAAKLAPADRSSQMNLVRFLLTQGSTQSVREAEQLLTTLVEQDPSYGPARRALALVLAQRGGEEGWKRIESLLGANEASQEDATLDGQLRAILLARQGGETNRAKARRILEDLTAAEATASDGNRLLLARLHEQDSQIAKARQIYESLAGRPNVPRSVLETYADFLIRQRDFETAQKWLDRLDAMRPDDWPAVALRALWLHRRGRTSQVEKLVETRCEGLLKRPMAPAQQADLAVAVGDLYRQVELDAAAERWYQRATTRPSPSAEHVAKYVDFLLEQKSFEKAGQALDQLEKLAPDDLPTLARRARWLKLQERSPEIETLVEAAAKKLLAGYQGDQTRESDLALAVGSLYSELEQHQAAERWFGRLRELSPERFGPLAVALVRQGRVDDAMTLCAEAASRAGSLRAAIILVTALAEADKSAVDWQRAEPLLANALAEDPDNTELLTSVASARILQGKNDEAIRLYESVVRKAPTNVLVLNNLATLLGELPSRRPEALKHVDQAIAIAGEQSALLDTKAAILLREGKPEEALPLLEIATAEAGSDPRFLVHLADARLRLGDKQKARDALDKAKQGDLFRYVLTQLDMQELEKLENGLRP